MTNDVRLLAFYIMPLKREQRLIKRLLDADQKDRASSSTFRKYSDKQRLAIISRRDEGRRAVLENLLKRNRKLKLRGIDYFRMGFMYLHSGTSRRVRKARTFGQQAADQGYKPGRWLTASATDRILTMQGKPQKFGTQFGKKPDGTWFMLPFSLSTTDTERKRNNVMPLNKIQTMINTQNRQPIRSRMSERLGHSRLT